MNLLFICSRNINRSRTAEDVFETYKTWNVRSAGTDWAARITVNSSHVRWADVIIVMERRHVNILAERFPRELEGKSVINLNIPDSYYYMDEELVALLKKRVFYFISP